MLKIFIIAIFFYKINGKIWETEKNNIVNIYKILLFDIIKDSRSKQIKFDGWD